MKAFLFLWMLCLCLTGCKPNDTTSAGIPQSLASPNTTAVTTDPPAAHALANSADKVFVCRSAGARKYHYDRNCHGLKRCTHTIVTMNRADAEGMGLERCGYED